MAQIIWMRILLSHYTNKCRLSFIRLFRKRMRLPVIALLVLGICYTGCTLWKYNLNCKNKVSNTTGLTSDGNKTQRLVILGAGPTGLGAAYRLYEEGILRTNAQVVVLERQSKPGGLAVSHRDKAGFLWDNGGHVVFSHYSYFTKLLDYAVSKWNKHERAAYAFMKGSSGNRSFIPYPVQDNVFTMETKDRELILEDIKRLTTERRRTTKKRSANFDEWLVNNFGTVLSDMFMRKYNRKVWTVDPKQMNAVWVRDRVALPNVEKMKKESLNLKNSKWGPNYFFRFPRYNGTGGIWLAVSELLPKYWFHYGHEVTGVNIKKKVLEVTVKKNAEKVYYLDYDVLITTAPLNVFVNMDQDKASKRQRELANELTSTITHIVGVGLRGRPANSLSDKSWIYFPDSDSPFYRATVFSKYSRDHIPHPESQWSLMCECAEPKLNSKNSTFWAEENIVKETIISLIKYGFIKKEQILSTFYHRLDYGYPVPSTSRERILSVIQPWLESNKVFSRGRFGGWRYEVGNQDHSLMQGVEIADFILKGVLEETYPNPNLVNSMKASKRIFKNPVACELFPDYEVILAHYNENLTWIAAHAHHCHVYHKGKLVVPDFRFKKWETLPNVGRESHTYLHHIITNYKRLANVTIFLQAGANQHTNNTYPHPRIYYEEAKQKGFSARLCFKHQKWGRLSFSAKWKTFSNKGLGSPLFRRSKFSLGEFWKDAFGSDHPRSILSCLKGNFAVTRAVIHKKPVDYYKKLIKYIDDSSDPEEGHYFERFWRDGVFSIF